MTSQPVAHDGQAFQLPGVCFQSGAHEAAVVPVGIGDDRVAATSEGVVGLLAADFGPGFPGESKSESAEKGFD